VGFTVVAARSVRYLVYQHNVAWARIRVPADVRHAFDGKQEVWERLGKVEQKIAEARCHRAASDFWARVAEARGRNGAVQDDALAWRRRIEDSQGDGGPEGDFSDVVADAAIALASDRFVPGGYKAVKRAADLFHEGSEGEALLELGGPEARTFVDIAIGGKKPLAPFVDPWNSARVTEVEAKTAFMDKTAVERFVGIFPLASDATPAAVAEWVEKRKVEGAVSAATLQRELSGLRSFWGHLKGRGEVPKDAPDPFAGLRLRTRAKAAANGGSSTGGTQRGPGKKGWVPFTPAQVVSLRKRAEKAGDTELVDLIDLGMWSGARIEELCALSVPEVDLRGRSFKVADAKTEAGVREVPIHAKLLPTFKRLIGDRRNGYVLADLTANKFGDRSGAIGKRFGRLKQRAGFGPAHVYHSIRKTVSTQLENAHVSENIAADILGHEKPRITYGLYSGGATLAVKRAALAKLRYPA
jgi:integrase